MKDWISVKEMLPENGQLVDVRGVPSVPFGQTAREVIVTDLRYWDKVGFIDNITHWRPAPEDIVA